MLRSLFFVTLSISLCTLTSEADDAGVKTDWSRFLPVNTIHAEVRKVDGSSITLRVYFMAPGPGNDENGNPKKATPTNTNKNRSNGNSRNSRNQSPLQRLIQQAKSQQQRVQYHQDHHDYDVAYFHDTKVTGKLPKPLVADDASTKAPLTPMSLTPGTIVNAVLIRDKGIALKDFSEKDLKARSLAIVGSNPHFKEDSTTTAKKK